MDDFFVFLVHTGTGSFPNRRQHLIEKLFEVSSREILSLHFRTLLYQVKKHEQRSQKRVSARQKTFESFLSYYQTCCCCHGNRAKVSSRDETSSAGPDRLCRSRVRARPSYGRKDNSLTSALVFQHMCQWSLLSLLVWYGQQSTGRGPARCHSSPTRTVARLLARCIPMAHKWESVTSQLLYAWESARPAGEVVAGFPT